ncbi:thiamine pyrophosphate-binding protein [Chloroflexota bacterium]
MAMVSSAGLVVRVPKAALTSSVLALSGDHTISIFDATLYKGIKTIDTRHEQATVHMADAWARDTRQSSVAVVTAGAGTTNAVPGMAVAFQSASPLALIAS